MDSGGVIIVGSNDDTETSVVVGSMGKLQCRQAWIYGSCFLVGKVVQTSQN